MPKGITWPDYKGAEAYFPGVPGVYGPGVVVPLASTDHSEAEMRVLIKGTPLEIVDLSKKQAKQEQEKDGEE